MTSPDGYVAPTDLRPITRLHNGSVEQVGARWGLIPYWAKDEKIGFKCINVRAETLATLPAFRGAYKLGHRCLVPACGFFEWETRPDGKQPFYFTSSEVSLLAFAGLWDQWRKPDGSEVLSYTIITTAPNDFVARFHDRMPVVLDERDYGRWLEGTESPQGLRRWVSRFGHIPILREHISIAPHERVDDHKHYYAYATTGVDISWHSPDIVSREPRRLSNFAVQLFGAILEDAEAAVGHEQVAARLMQSANQLGFTPAGPDETPLGTIERHGRWLREFFDIRQFVVVSDSKRLAEIRNEL
jgi:putative SOS response-associated peptidase YedK